ncbi:MAG: DUF1294 domain-containing protein [Alphaproteobacteria bacterium]|nr:MAG: DUF1294 domain-containing protein [Alphaproteobacteria bacterium]
MAQKHTHRPRTSRKNNSRASTYIWSLLPGLGIPAAFTWAYATTLNFNPVYTWLVFLNLTLIGLMGKDKFAAKKGWARTPEFTLLLLAFLGATPALLLSRMLFNHKTTKQSFQYSLFGVMAVQLALVIYFWAQISPYL